MEKKMGFFEKLKKSLSKAGNGMLGAIFAGGERVNNEFYEELEEAMIVADMGMDTAERLIDALRDSLDEKGIKTRTEARQELRRIVADEMRADSEFAADKGPAVLLIVGVNGVGKTTSIGKLAAYYISKGRQPMMAAADTVRAAAAVERIGMIAMIYVGETLLITPYDDLGFGSYKTNEGYLTSKKVVPSVAEYIADHHLSVDKIFVRSQDPVTLLRTRAILEQIPGIRVMSSAADNLEVITPAADKGTALGMLCRDIGTDLDHAAAIGDSENDFEMLRAVALPIAMGNASSEVKALCRWETDTNAEDGVAHAIDRILAHNKACDEQAENSGI